MKPPFHIKYDDSNKLFYGLIEQKDGGDDEKGDDGAMRLPHCIIEQRK